MFTVLCAFADRQDALIAITRMIKMGLPRDDIHVQPTPDFYAVVPDEPSPATPLSTHLGRLMQFLRGFAPVHTPGAEGTYRDAIRRGSTVVVVHVADAEAALQAGTLMAEMGAFDVEHASNQWTLVSGRGRVQDAAN